MRSFALLAATALVASLQHTDAYTITETASGLVTDIPDATISGTTDNWTVQLGQGWIFVYSSATIPVGLSEPEGGSVFGLPFLNQISFSDAVSVAPLFTATKLTWNSEVPFNPFAPLPIDDSLTLGVFHGTLSLTSVASPVVLSDQGDSQGVPETASTLLLLSLPLLGMFGAARGRR